MSNCVLFDGAKEWWTMQQHGTRVSAVTSRSRVVLEIASELVAQSNQPLRLVKVLMRDQGTESRSWPLTLFASSTIEGIDAVVSREAALAIINPASVLSLAYRGLPPFDAPRPVRTIAVIPSHDRLLFAVKSEIGITSLEEVAERKIPLRIVMRGQDDHCIHLVFEQIARAAGFSIADLASWGGSILKRGPTPRPGAPQFKALMGGEVDAIVDEAADTWIEEALLRGMTPLTLRETTVSKLEASGYRRGVIRMESCPGLQRDLLTIDFSGWPIFVHEQADDMLVEQICAALVARKDLIPWHGDGPLPVERMFREAPDTPLGAPLHPAAERFWNKRGEPL